MQAPHTPDTRVVALPQRRVGPRPPACLVHIYPPGSDAGRRYSLTEKPFLIGRTAERDLRIDDNSVSRRHAQILPAGEGGYTVEDLGSCNGTWVNDQPVAGVRPLQDGDYLRVGNCIYRYLAGGNVEAEYHEEIYRLTIQDPLTRLPNRRVLDEFLAREVVRSRRHERPLSVVLLDIDRFKSVNDTHGHLCGDAVLRELAERLRVATRAEDMAARYGGEEFALVLVEAAHPEALAAAERLRSAIADRPFRFEGGELPVTASFGVATTCGDAAATPADLLHTADGRLYAAKRGGRNRVVGDGPIEGDPFETVVAK